MTVLGLIKRMVNAQLARVGHIVVREDVLLSFDRFVSLLRRANLTPQTVIDIGVADGTPWLYGAFPGAKFHLVDPTRESLPYMQSWASKLDAEIYNVALGSKNGTLEIATRSTIIHASLFHSIIDHPIQERYEVPVQRFDSIIPAFARPSLCKIDVEGAEHLVLQGIADRIHDFDAFIIETSLNSLYHDGHDFREIVAHMAENNFSFFDICGLIRRPYDGALHQIDAVFVPDQSPLRVRRWD